MQNILCHLFVQHWWDTSVVTIIVTSNHTYLWIFSEKHLSIVENLKEYKKMLVGIGMDHAETSGGLDCFDINQAKAITDYLYIRSVVLLI